MISYLRPKIIYLSRMIIYLRPMISYLSRMIIYLRPMMSCEQAVHASPWRTPMLDCCLNKNKI